ncbi:Trp family transcriptional regulator [Streptomyces chartreusis]|uniref:hypothetical protein n=1 Tax=Streptomyces chartreusis TaxID=1969 RepID=UPI00386B823E|nr:Trp family transcriptional regulator [Streptomyces chartreusis]
MTGVRADVAELLRAGATHAEIKQQLHVSGRTITRTRKALHIPQPTRRAKRNRAELAALEDQAVTMLRAKATYTEVHAITRLSPNRISELRKQHAIPVPTGRDTAARRRRTIEEAFALHTQPTDGGHLLWTGPRSGRTPDLRADGGKHNPRTVAFRRHHGREPEGNLKRTCEQPDCIAGAHLTDRRIRQAHAHADQAYDHIFGPVA